MDVLRLARKNIPLLVALAAAFLLVTALSIFIIRRETDRNRILMQWEASRVASLLLEVDMSQSLLDDPLLLESLERVVGFGVYRVAGFDGSRVRTTAEALYKSAPLDLSGYELAHLQDVFITRRERGTLVYIRPFAAVRGGVIGFPPALTSVNARFLYVEIDVRGSLRLQTLYNVGLGAVPLVIAALTALAGVLGLKNADYRERIVAQERLARLGDAARTLAHELKNPLNVIKLRSRIVRRIAGQAAADDLDVVEREVEHLSGLTDRIREFLQDPLGSPEQVELEGYVRELCGRSGWGVEITTDGQAPYAVRFDPARLRSVVENLVRNARESMEAAKTQGSAEIRIRRERGRVILSVMDRGAGVDTKEGDKLFDPFYTTKLTGSGIGLSISRRFVEAAHGSIELSNRPGGGAEARISLPAGGPEDST